MWIANPFPVFALQEPPVFEQKQCEITGRQKQGNISARLKQQPKPGAGQREKNEKGEKKDKPLRFPGIPEDTKESVKTLATVKRFYRQQIEDGKQQITLKKNRVLLVNDQAEYTTA